MPNLADAGWTLQCSYASLPESFYSWVEPTPVRHPTLVVSSASVANRLGLDPTRLTDEDQVEIFAGNRLPPASKPLAQAYAGHQYGGFTMLGDGRAILLGEQLSPSGQLYDVQLKGPGPTPYSRRGDGRASLGPMLREFIISQAMSALGIPTTLSLAVAQTGQPVYRRGPEPGAVLTRVAASHIRVGTFQYAAARGNADDLRALADYTLQRHYPELIEVDHQYLEFLKAVVYRQASLIAKWMSVGFIHGVMNTDNVSIVGETIDYGPCAFMNTYHAQTVFSSIDEQGRYAYGNQPSICQWNLARLAETLLQLLDTDIANAIQQATQVIDDFPRVYRKCWLTEMGRKLGIEQATEADEPLITDLLIWMERHKLDFTNTFRNLTERRLSQSVYDDLVFQEWLKRWELRLGQPGQDGSTLTTIGQPTQIMARANPAVIPRNHLVESALESAVSGGDIGAVEKLLDVLDRPFDSFDSHDPHCQPPAGGDGDYCTYCGT